MARVDIVVFPNGGREIFGQVDPAAPEHVAAAIAEYLAKLAPVDKPRKFTGYYDAPDASDIEWQAYNENNPIVQVPVELDPDEASNMDIESVDVSFQPMELAQVPAAMKAQILIATKG